MEKLCSELVCYHSINKEVHKLKYFWARDWFKFSSIHSFELSFFEDKSYKEIEWSYVRIFNLHRLIFNEQLFQQIVTNMEFLRDIDICSIMLNEGVY